MKNYLIRAPLVRLATQVAIQRITGQAPQGTASKEGAALLLIHTIVIGMLANQTLVRQLFDRHASIAVEEIKREPRQHALVAQFIRDIAIPHLSPRTDHDCTDTALTALRAEIDRYGGSQLVEFYHQLTIEFLALL